MTEAKKHVEGEADHYIKTLIGGCAWVMQLMGWICFYCHLF